MTTAMFSGLLIAFLISTASGYAICSWLLPRSLSRRLAWAMAPAVGFGLFSFTFFLFRRPMFSVEFALAAIAVWVVCRRRSFANLVPIWRKPSPLVVILSGGLGLAAAGFLLRVDRMPHGNWDGWAIWNTHARLLFRDGPDWKKDMQYSYHGDYPLLMPTTTARFWRYAGGEVPEAGALVGIISALGAVAVLAITLSQLRGGSAAMLLPLILVGTPSYLDHATSQYADVPLSFFILSVLALICLHSERGDESDRRTLILAGFLAGCAGWTKNEGLLFITAVCTVLMLPVLRIRWKALPRFLAFCCGLALPLLVIIIFKWTIPTYNDLIENQYDTLGKIMDLSRHTSILKYAATRFSTFGEWPISPWLPLLGFIVFHGVERGIMRNSGLMTSTVILGIVLGGYYVVYLVTPIELQLHLDSSLNRLLLQLWPSFLLVAGLLCKKAG